MYAIEYFCKNDNVTCNVTQNEDLRMFMLFNQCRLFYHPDKNFIKRFLRHSWTEDGVDTSPDNPRFGITTDVTRENVNQPLSRMPLWYTGGDDIQLFKGPGGIQGTNQTIYPGYNCIDERSTVYGGFGTGKLRGIVDFLIFFCG